MTEGSYMIGEAAPARGKPPLIRWWICYFLVLTYLLLPGPDRTVFSGLPMALKTQALLIPLLILGLFCAFFSPSRPLKLRWLVAISAAIALKIVLASMLVDTGWKGTYWWVKTWRQAETTLVRMNFYQQQAVRPYRLDRTITFTPVGFALHFINERPGRNSEYAKLPRHTEYPLRVDWTGHVHGGDEVSLEFSANGSLTLDVDGQQVFAARDPNGATARLSRISPENRVRITYEKPPAVEPAISVRGFENLVLTPAPTTERALTASRWATSLIVIVGAFALLALMGAFLEAYAPISRLFLETIWEHTPKLAAIGFVAIFLGLGFVRSIPFRQATVHLTHGDDFLTYASNARQILYNGILMVDRDGSGGPYYHYPLYPYALATAHILFGEDFSTIVLFNFACIASLGLLFWVILKGRISDGAFIAVLLVLTMMGVTHLARYALTAYSDNLYLPAVFGTIALFIRAFESPSATRLFAVGIATALGAATRPSFLIFVPFAVCGILLDRRMGPLLTRVRNAFSYGLGFLAGVSPFTLRNWLVTGSFVLLVSSFVMLPLFLYAPEEQVPSFSINGAPPGLVDSVKQFIGIVIERPLESIWVECRKVGFTLGITALGPKGGTFPSYFLLFSLLFAFALWTRRIPWAVQTTLLIFALSHLAAILIATPWTYGYKTILPFHLALLLGIAFLLPDWRAQPVRRRDSHPPPTPQRPVVSVVLPTYNEKDSIRGVIKDFFATGIVDEVIVVNNNAVAGTSTEVEGTGAREVMEPVQGYGAACQRGLSEARGDYIVLCEPDGTFAASDIFKLLAYAEDFDVVYGSRTSQQFVWQGANMGFFLRFGNWAVAKYMEFVFNGPNLTDVGCTMRLIKRHVADALKDTYEVRGSQFGPEMMVLTLRRGVRMVQIPVNYRPRVGLSSVTGDPQKALTLGVQMIALITRHVLRSIRESASSSRERARSSTSKADATLQGR